MLWAIVNAFFLWVLLLLTRRTQSFPETHILCKNKNARFPILKSRNLTSSISLPGIHVGWIKTRAMCYGRGHTGTSAAGTMDSIGLKAGSTSTHPPSRERVACRVRAWVPACAALLQPSKTGQPPAQMLQRLPNTQRRKYKFSTTASVTHLISHHFCPPPTHFCRMGLFTLLHCAKHAPCPVPGPWPGATLRYSQMNPSLKSLRSPFKTSPCKRRLPWMCLDSTAVYHFLSLHFSLEHLLLSWQFFV